MPILVNKVEITDDQVHAEMQHHPASSVDQARHQAAQTLVIQQLLLQDAVKKKLVENSVADDLSSEGVELAIDTLLKQEISVPEADDEVCNRYYQQNLERFVDKKTGQQLVFMKVNSHIRDYLHIRSLQTGISQYIKILAGNAKIIGFDLEGSDSALVQ